MNNEHVEKYLDYYSEPERILPFAILLKGRWGCGKTYFIKNYINQRKKSIEFVHVSLYGIESFGEIKERIAIELIPLIPEKYTHHIQKIYKLVKKIPKLKEYVPSHTDELLVDIFLTNKKNCIFIFDDLERCCIPIDKTLGFINNFVEFRNQKVILISDEYKILNSDKSDKYREIKEKLIGKELTINPSIDESINYFISCLTDKELLQHSDQIKTLLSEIFAQSKYDNLRLIQQALSQYEYFFKSFSSKAKADKELFHKMFYEFIVIFVEYKKGRIKSEDFDGEYPYFFRGIHRRDDESHFLDKYNYGIANWLTCFKVEILGKILRGDMLSENEKKDLIENLEDLAAINLESWQKVWHYSELEDADFFENLDDVIDKWDKKEYTDFSKMLHVYGMFLDFSKKGFLKMDTKKLLNECKKYIEFLIESGKFPIDLKQQKNSHCWSKSAYGLQYSGMDNEEWKELIDFINKKNDDLEEKNIKQKIEEELMPVLKNISNFHGDLQLYVNCNFIHYLGKRIAYFQYLNVDEIARIIVKCDRYELHQLQEVFENRYVTMKDEIEGIEREKTFLNNLYDMLINSIHEIENEFDNKHTPRSFMLTSFASKALEPHINSRK